MANLNTYPSHKSMGFEISSDFHDHWDTCQLEPSAIAAFVFMGSWSAATRNGGFIPHEAPIAEKFSEYIPQLVEAGLLYEAPDGWDMDHGKHYSRPLFRFLSGEWRPKIPAALRARVYERDGHVCLHCGTTENLSLDHIIPWSKGGPDTYENFQTLCRSCNARKGNR